MWILNLILIAQSLKVVPSVGEVTSIDLTTLFDVSNPVYGLKDDKDYFQIQEPISKVGNSVNNFEGIVVSKLVLTNVLKVKAKKTIYGSWLNHFAVMSENKILFAEKYNLKQSSSQDQQYVVPSFIDPLSFEGVTCLDFDYVTDAKFIADCVDDQGITKFQTVEFNQATTDYPINTLCANGVHTIRNYIQFLTEENYNQYILRGVRCTEESSIQFYQLLPAGPRLVLTITADTLITAFNLGADYKFLLKDFLVTQDERIMILDSNGLYVIRINQNKEISKVEFKIALRAIAFDYNEIMDDDGVFQQRLVILYDDRYELFIDDQDKKVINLVIPVTAQAQIGFSNIFLVISDNSNVYLYQAGKPNLLGKSILTGGLLINPYFPDLIQVTVTESARYQLSRGALVFNGNKQELASWTTLTVTANEQSKIVDYQVPNALDAAPYLISQEQVLTKPITSEVQTQDANIFASGPDQYYKQIATDQVEMTFIDQYEIKSLSQVFPKAAQIHYQDMIQFHDTLIYQLIQLKDNSVQIWMCFLEIDESGEVCSLETTLHLAVLIDKLRFQWWVYEATIHLVYVDVDGFYIYKLVNKKVEEETKIVIPAIQQIIYLNLQIYVLADVKVFVYSTLSSKQYQRIGVIDSKAVKSLGFTQSWSPVMLFGNPFYNNHLLFIQNNNNIMLIKYTNELTLIQSIAYQKGSIDIAIFKETFFIVLSTGLIEEWSLGDLNRIYLLKVLPTYNIQIYPTLATQSADNGYLVVPGIYNNKQVLLFYAPNRLLRESLYRVIDIQSKPTQVQVCGKDFLQVYLNYGDSQQWIQLLLKMKVQTKTKFVSNQYSSLAVQTMLIQNRFISFQFLERVTIINTMKDVTTKPLVEVKIKKQSNDQLIDLGNQWYSGQVVNFGIQCSQPDQVLIFDTIHGINVGPFDKYTIADITSYDDESVFLTPTGLLLVNDQNSIKSEIKFKTAQQCMKVTSDYSKSQVAVLCLYNGVYTVVLIECKKDQCEEKTSTELNGIVAIQKIILTNNWLFLQDLTEIFIYQITAWVPKVDQTLVPNIIDITLHGVQDFLVQIDKKQQTLVSILCSNSKLLLLTADASIPQFSYKSKFTADILGIITDGGQYYSSSTMFFRLVPLSDPVFNPTLQSVSLLAIASDVAHYAININVNNIKNSKIEFILNQYGDWHTQSKIAYSSDYVAIPYANKEKVVLGVYKLQQQTATVTMIGGLEWPIEGQKISALVVSFFDKNRMYSNVVRYNEKIRITTYELNDSPILYVKSGLKLDNEQSITLTARNDFTSSSIQSTLKEIISKGSSGSNLWWIILLTIVLVAITGGVTYYVWRRRNLNRPLTNYQDFSLHSK